MPSVKGNNEFLILYGSQTGQAQAIAEELLELGSEKGFSPTLFCLDLTEKKFSIEKEACVVFVTSTTGDGDPPDNAAKFMRRLNKKTLQHDHLKDLNYALLALGDSNYSNFCMCGKKLDRRLQNLGANQFYATGHADDAVGLEIVVEPWIENLWPALRKHLDAKGNEDKAYSTSQTNDVSDGILGYSTLNGPLDAQNIVMENTENIVNIERTFDKIPILGQEAKLSNNGSLDNPGKANTTNASSNDHSNIIEKCQTADEALCNGFSTPKRNTDSEPPKDFVESLAQSTNGQIKNHKPDFCSDSLDANDRTVSEQSHNNLDHSVDGCLNASQDLQKEVTVHAPRKEDILKAALTELSINLKDSVLKLPSCPQPFLKFDFIPELEIDLKSIPFQGGMLPPFAASEIRMAHLTSSRLLTRPGSLKTTLEINLKVEGLDSYEPGDSFGILCRNRESEVSWLIERLGIPSKADHAVKIELDATTSKKAPKIPEFIPTLTTMRELLSTCLDIRTVPKKAFLRLLSEYTGDEKERRRIQEFASSQGSSEYSTFIRDKSLGFIDVLQAFKSCMPPVERLVENLPRLLPRPYSVCSSMLSSESRIRFAFNVTEIDDIPSIRNGRKGLCTGWLSELSSEYKKINSVDGTETSVNSELNRKLNKLELEDRYELPIYLRRSSSFRLPTDLSAPVIMIGPGTGVAPFIGFLEHRFYQKQSTPEASFGEMILFFGCRHKENDYLFQNELKTFQESGVLSHLFVSFSRDEDCGKLPAPKYVQDNILLNADLILSLLLDKNGTVYVCGDAKNMARNVNDVFIEILNCRRNMSIEDAKETLKKLRTEGKFLEDVWT